MLPTHRSMRQLLVASPLQPQGNCSLSVRSHNGRGGSTPRKEFNQQESKHVLRPRSTKHENGSGKWLDGRGGVEAVPLSRTSCKQCPSRALSSHGSRAFNASTSVFLLSFRSSSIACFFSSKSSSSAEILSSETLISGQIFSRNSRISPVKRSINDTSLQCRTSARSRPPENYLFFHEIIMFGVPPMTTECFIARCFFEGNVSRFTMFLAISGERAPRHQTQRQALQNTMATHTTVRQLSGSLRSFAAQAWCRLAQRPRFTSPATLTCLEPRSKKCWSDTHMNHCRK